MSDARVKFNLVESPTPEEEVAINKFYWLLYSHSGVLTFRAFLCIYWYIYVFSITEFTNFKLCQYLLVYNELFYYIIYINIVLKLNLQFYEVKMSL
uniref:Uncharacterized protein n=1 Tax=Heterorhabditis bacteriophora TaxID=37862 RepID=A0A1I7WJE3_HETBA